MSFRLLQGRGTGLAAVTLGLALLVTPLALAGNDRGEPVEIELRNRSNGETGLVTASDDYSLRLSNTTEGGGGGAVYGCRAPDAAPRENLACLYADNLRGGKAFLFRSRQGDSVGHFDIGDPTNPPFTTNARGLVENLNAEMVGGLTAQQLLARTPAEARPGPQGPQGPQGPRGATGPQGATGPRGPSNAFVAQDRSGDLITPSQDSTVTLALPAGSYILQASAVADARPGDNEVTVNCHLLLGTDRLGTATESLAPLGTDGQLIGSLATGGTVTLADAGEVAFMCTGGFPLGGTRQATVDNAVVTAIQVADVQFEDET